MNTVAATKPRHPEATNAYINQLIKSFGLTLTEVGVFHLTIGERADWHPEVTCTFITEARARGNDGLLAIVALALSPEPGAHPGGLGLDRDHELQRVGSIWDYLDLLTGFIREDSKDHWKAGNCSSKKAGDEGRPRSAKCTKREHAESALGFLRMAASDTNHREHAVTYYVNLCLKYGATQDEVSAALLGEGAVAA